MEIVRDSPVDLVPAADLPAHLARAQYHFSARRQRGSQRTEHPVERRNMRENIDHCDDVEFAVASKLLEGDFANLAACCAAREPRGSMDSVRSRACACGASCKTLKQVPRAAADVQKRSGVAALVRNRGKMTVVIEPLTLIPPLAIQQFDPGDTRPMKRTRVEACLRDRDERKKARSRCRRAARSRRR